VFDKPAWAVSLGNQVLSGATLLRLFGAAKLRITAATDTNQTQLPIPPEFLVVTAVSAK